METNCQAHIKEEQKGPTTVYWRCLEPHTEVIVLPSGIVLHVCASHKKEIEKELDN